MKPYTLTEGEGRAYDWEGPIFVIKAGPAETGGGLAFMELLTRKGEEPPPHTHPDEDEIFYVLEGSVTFTCGAETLDAGERAFVFLPRGIRHAYRINSDGPVRMLVLTTPGGFGAHVEEAAEPAAPGAYAARIAEMRSPT